MSFSSWISPKISSIISSRVTNPATPQYSSITRAMCLWIFLKEVRATSIGVGEGSLMMGLRVNSLRVMSPLFFSLKLMSSLRVMTFSVSSIFLW